MTSNERSIEAEYLMQAPDDLKLERSLGLIEFTFTPDDEKQPQEHIALEPSEALWLAGELVRLAREVMIEDTTELRRQLHEAKYPINSRKGA